jgi:hypothetical protein
MNIKVLRTNSALTIVRCIGLITCAALILTGTPLTRVGIAQRQSGDQSGVKPASDQQEAKQGEDEPAVKIPAEQLDALVAPIALYPDPLLAQTLAASTYPLELVQLQQWLEKNEAIAKDQAKLAEAVKKQPWDPSIQAMAALPDVVKRLADDIQWTTDLGNAFLAQQTDVMDSVQRMRAKAKGNGALVDE